MAISFVLISCESKKSSQLKDLVEQEEDETSEWALPHNTSSSSHNVYTVPSTYIYSSYSYSSASTPDDAYDEGYDEGYEQGESDAANGYGYESGYDDSSDYYDYYETKYEEGYADGYEEGYADGRDEYNEELDEDDW